MELTEKLGLKKPGLTDYVNIGDLNENMDILNEEVGSMGDDLESHKADNTTQAHIDAIATLLEAVTGETNEKFMTPMLTKKLVDSVVKIAQGSYVGNASDNILGERKIIVGFRPKLVLVFPTTTTTQANGGLSIDGAGQSLTMYRLSDGGAHLMNSSNSNYAPRITDDGFFVNRTGTTSFDLNGNGRKYNWFAIG